MTPKSIDLNALRIQSLRAKEDAETILQLCEGVNQLHAENTALQVKVKVLEAEAPKTASKP